MKKFYMMLIALLTVLSANAQDEYRDLFKEYSRLSCLSTSILGNREQIKAIVMISGVDKEKKAEKLTDLYISNQKEDDVVDMFLSTAHNTLSETDLKDLITFYNTPLGKLAAKYANEQASDDVSTELGKKVTQNMDLLKEGKEPVYIEVNVSDEYRKAFDRLYEAGNYDSQIKGFEEQMFGFIKNMATSFSADKSEAEKAQLQKDMDSFIEKMSIYTRKEFKNILLLRFSKIYSASDINEMTKFTQTPLGKKEIVFENEISKNAMQISFQLISKIKDFVDKNK